MKKVTIGIYTTLFFAIIFSFSITAKITGQVLLADINQDSKGSHPERLLSNGEDLVFLADGDEGNAIYILNESENDPEELLNLTNYGYGDFIYSGYLIDSLYFFVTGSDGIRYIHVLNIYTGDVTNLQQQPGSAGSYSIGGLTKVDGEIYVIAKNLFGNSAIYNFDESSMSISQVFELQEPNVGISEIFELNGSLMFTQNQLNTDFGYFTIWNLDVSTGNLEKISPGDMPMDFLDIGSFNLTQFNGELFFINFEVETGHEIWHSDGTAEGTEILVDFTSGPDFGVFSMHVYDDYIYFLSNKDLGETNLYRTDGTVDGFEQVTTDLGDQDILRVRNYIVDGGRVFFLLEDEQHGNELWVNQGDGQGTFLLTEVNLGPKDGIPSNVLWTIQNEELFFIAESEESGKELWKSDGTESGTKLIRDIYLGKESSEISQLVKFKNELIFDAEDVEFGSELWKYSFDQDDAVLVSDINTITSGSSFPLSFALLNDKLIFSAEVDCIGRELFSTEGSAKSTILLNDIAQGKESNYFFHFEEFNGKFYFPAANNDNYQSYWFTDGSTEGTNFAFDPSYLEDLNFQSLSNLGSFKNKLYFLASKIGIGLALFESDGTNEGTNLIKVLSQNGGSSSQFRFYNLNDEVLIFESYESLGRGVWSSDGTEQGTFLLQSGNSFSRLKIINEDVYYLKNESSNNRSLWKTNGTIEGTVRVSPEILFGDITSYIKYDGFTYYVMRDFNTYVLFRTDESINETVEIASPGFEWLDKLMILNDKILTAGKTFNEKELWSYDTSDKEWEEIEINTDDVGSLATIAGVIFEDQYYFMANDGEHGDELWVTDGTSENTKMIMDLWPGSGGSNPRSFIVYQDFIYFSADANDGSGAELYKYSPNDKDNDGYLLGIDIDDNDPTVNVDDPNDPDDVDIFCSSDGPNFVKEFNSLNGIVNVSPNPTVDQIKIDLKSVESHQVQIFTSDGQMIIENNDAHGQIEFNLSFLPKGLYKLRIISDQGMKNGMWNIIIQ